MRNLFMGATLAAVLPLGVGMTSAATAGGGIDLAVTLGYDPTPGACGTDTTLEVTRGDQINYCYVVTNGTAVPLTFHTLSDDVTGSIFTDLPETIAPGASYQYNRVVVATESVAPTSTWTAYDVHPAYVHEDGTIESDVVFADGFDGGAPSTGFIDISGTGTNLELFDDDFSYVPIGFPFTFYGETGENVTVSNNGGILFAPPGLRGRIGYLSPVNRTLPDRMIGPAILPFWDDIQQDYIDGIGNVFVETEGEAPNRRFVVEWFNLPVSFGGGGETVTFEAILFEGSNDIEFLYQDTDCGSDHCNNGASATIGLNSDRTHAVLYSFDETTAGSGKTIRFHPTQPESFTASAQATLDVGAPVVGIDPDHFDKTVAAGASTSDTMTISNTGNRALTWNIGSVGARAHFPPVSRFALPVGDPAETETGPRPVAPGKARAVQPLAPMGVPAYAADLVNASLVSLDVTDPSTLTSDISMDGNSFLAGDFKGEDFSTLYAIDFLSFDLYKVDTATGARTLVYLSVPPPGAQSGSWNGMAWDASTQTMYAITLGGRPTGSSLVKINPDTADTEFVGPITGVGDPNNGTAIIDIAIDANGLMYGVDIVTDTLVAIDKTTGEASTIGSIGFDANYAEGLDFDDTTNTLYFSAFDNGLGASEMYVLDTETGEGTPIGTIGPDPSSTQYAALAIARMAGICSYPDGVPWLSYSASRGSTDPGATTPITVTFDATTLSPGRYSANVCVNNNDLTHQRFAVPVTLTVD
jgi:hypothetical protein